MANDRHSYLVVEESLPEGTIAEHRRARRPKEPRPVAAKRRRLSGDQPVTQSAARRRPPA